MSSKSSKARAIETARSLPTSEWPPSDQEAWAVACRAGTRFRPGGEASRYADVSRNDFVNRYGAFLGFLQRSGCLDLSASAAAQVTPTMVDSYLADLNSRVSSVAVWNAIYKLRMAARLLDPKADFAWLAEIEKDLALVMEPRSKFDRVVLSQHLMQAGLTLIVEAKQYAKSPFQRAKGIRNGLIIALMAAAPIRVKNYTALDIGTSFKEVDDTWWIIVPRRDTKTNGGEERPVPDYLNTAIDLYLKQSRPILIGKQAPTTALWISSRTGQRFTTKNLGTLISKITLQTIGVDVSPHLFRTAAATTLAVYAGDKPHLASAVLGHSDKRVADDHYKRASTVQAALQYAAIVQQMRS
jgi:site-specific recombinase XerD